MLTTALLLALTFTVAFVLIGLLSDPGGEAEPSSTHHSHGEELEYQRVIKDIYLVQMTPDLGPPPPPARIEPIENRIHIRDC
jgi:hypothetical protein